MAKPVLLLDIDGVLAPFLSHESMDAIAEADDEKASQLPHKEVRINAFNVVYVRHDLPEIMESLMPHFELMWGTAWGGDQANAYMLKHLGLENPLAAIDYLEHIPEKIVQRLSGAQWIGEEDLPDFWKMPWIEQFAEDSGRPLVFIDDEIGPESEGWAAERTASGIPTWLIKTDATIGWADHHKNELIEWAKGIENDHE